MKTTVLVQVTHTKPIEGLADKVAGRAWSIDGVTFAEAVPTPALQHRDLVDCGECPRTDGCTAGYCMKRVPA